VYCKYCEEHTTHKETVISSYPIPGNCGVQYGIRIHDPPAHLIALPNVSSMKRLDSQKLCVEPPDSALNMILPLLDDAFLSGKLAQE
jgi:hypothetical protein